MEITAKKAVKCNSEPGDGHNDGTPCLIIGETLSIPDSDIKLYFTLWEDFSVPVAIASSRLIVLEEKKDINFDETEYSDYLVDSKMLILYEKNKEKSL